MTAMSEQFETLYRMQGGSPDGTLGLSWTRDQNVASGTGLGGRGERNVHSATVRKDQTISEGTWKGDNIRRQFTDPSSGKTHTNPTQWGLPMEQELRLRPGAEVTDHRVASVDQESGRMSDFSPSGRTPTIEHGGQGNFINLAQHAVPGTKQHKDMWDFQGAQPHVQMSMLESIQDRDTGKEIGLRAPMQDTSAGWGADIDQWFDETDAWAKSQGSTRWTSMGDKPLERPLGELRK